MSKNFWRSAFLKSDFNHDFPFVVLNHVLAVDCIIKSTLEEVDAEVSGCIVFKIALIVPFAILSMIGDSISAILRTEG